MAVGAEVLGPGDKNKQDTLFDLSVVPYDETSGRDQNGKLKDKGGPPETTPEERRAMHANRGNTGPSSPDGWQNRGDINNG